MPRHKSAEKRVHTNLRDQRRNLTVKSELKTLLKNRLLTVDTCSIGTILKHLKSLYNPLILITLILFQADIKIIELRLRSLVNRIPDLLKLSARAILNKALQLLLKIPLALKQLSFYRSSIETHAAPLPK